MLNFLHTFSPTPVLLTIGPINVYWYGLFLVLGMLGGIFIILKLAEYYCLSKDLIIDLIFWLIIGGIVGARIYEVLLEFPYYMSHPIDIFKVWQGGLAIHGALIAGLVILYFYTKRHKISFWLVASILAPGAAFGQAIGRWGNYFNQELFGLPTSSSWGIPINSINRPVQYFYSNYFHPAFLYESVGNIIICGILLILHYKTSIGKRDHARIAITYLMLYSFLRFLTEFIRIDKTPIVLGLRLPQIVSLLLILGSLVYLRKFHKTTVDLNIKEPALEK